MNNIWDWLGPGLLLTVFLVLTLIRSNAPDNEMIDEKKTRRYNK